MQIIIYQLILLEEDLIGLFKKPYFNTKKILHESN